MPPSGYSEKAVNGLTIFIDSCCEDLLKEVKSGKHKSLKAAIRYEIANIKKALMRARINEVVNGSLVFIKGCYEGLLKEVQSAKYKDLEKAIESNRARIKEDLMRVHINSKGKLVMRHKKSPR